MKLSLATSLVALGNVVSAANSLPSIEVIGNKFFYTNNGSQFYIKGVAYQSNSVVNSTSGSSFNDPLSDPSACKRDIPYLEQLGTNLIRVYAINTSVDHSECMSAFNDAGIYVLSDLSEPGLSISDADPEWNVELFSRYAAVVDALGNYSNVLGFFAGNEVINGKNGSAAAPFVKAAIRDTKSYIKQNFKRSIPVGFAASDVASVRVPEADYFACGDDSQSADFYGVNIYEWCGDSNFVESGYAARTEEMKNMSRPVFFSEYGCNAVKPRTFQEVGALYGSNMTGVWSGGIVYEYFEEVNEYGLVSVSGNSVSTLTDYNNLKTALANISPSIASASQASASATTIGCPAQTATGWNAATALPPTPNENVCACLSPGSGCVIKDSVDADDYADIFGYVCGQNSDLCAGITGNGTEGTYGAFVGCNPKDKLNYVLGLYYNSLSSDASACDFSGSATTQGASTAGSCKAYFSQAGDNATGVVSATGLAITANTAAGATAGSGSSGSGSGSASGSGSKASATGKSSGSASGSSSGSSSKSKNAAPTANIKLAAAGVAGGAVALVAGLI